MTEPHTPTQAELADLRDVLADETDRNRRHSREVAVSRPDSTRPGDWASDLPSGSQSLTDRFGWRRHPRIQEQP